MAMNHNRDEALCTTPDIDSCISSEISRTPAILSAGLCITLPATKATCDLFAGGTINVFSQGNGIAVIPGLGSFSSPDLVNSTTVACCFLLRGLAVRVSVGARSYAEAGVCVVKPATISDVPALTQMPDACSPNRPATHNHNQSAMSAAKEFLEAFVLYSKLGCQYILTNERLADMGFLGASNTFLGFGTASTPTHSDIHAMNNYYANVMKSDCQFLPLNAAGSCCSDTPAIPLPEPLVEVQWGGPAFEGKYGGVFPVPMCLVLCPGMPLQFYLQTLPGTQCWLNLFLADICDEGEVTYGDLWNNRLVQTSCTGTTVATVVGTAVSPSGVSTPLGPAATALPAGSVCSVTGGVSTVAPGWVITITAGPGIGTYVAGSQIPATAVAGTCTSTQIGWSSSVVFKSGIISIEVALIGYELDTDSALQFFQAYGHGMVGNVRELYMTHASGYLQTAMMNNPQYRGVAGVAGLFDSGNG